MKVASASGRVTSVIASPRALALPHLLDAPALPVSVGLFMTCVDKYALWNAGAILRHARHAGSSFRRWGVAGSGPRPFTDDSRESLRALAVVHVAEDSMKIGRASKAGAGGRC